MPEAELTVLTWNVQGRVRSVAEQAEALAEVPADLVALQEVRATAIDAWRAALGVLGLVHVVAPEVSRAAPPERRLGVVLAAREPLRALDPLPGLPWPERHAAALTADGVEVHNLHAPISGRAGGVKVTTLELVAAELARPREHPVVLAGDLNTPQYESREGEVRSFARTRGGRIRDGFDERHDLAELGLVPGLADHGYTDAFRAVHGYLARDRSWVYPGRPKAGWRLDHLFARGLEVEDAAYVHAWRERGLSDHSALWARWRAPA